MSDLPSALGIEAVELVAEGGRNVTVRVTGRWRRRRPELRGQAMLVVETGSVRQRFVSMPEPPSLTGAAPGTWRMSFTVPAELAPQLHGRTFLQLGTMMVPLPVGEVPAPVAEVNAPAADALTDAGDEREEDGTEADLLEARLLRSSELAAESARRREAEAEAAVAELRSRVEQIEDELAAARAESDRLRDAIAERERRLRSSEQDAHAERAFRGEVEQALAAKTRATSHDLRVLHDHVADLERELGRMRRTVDEAQHQAAAAEAARADAVRRLAERPPPVAPANVDAVRTRLIAAEFERARAAPPTAPAAPSRPIALLRDVDRAALRLEAAMVDTHVANGAAEQRAVALERELADARDELADSRNELGGVRDALADTRNELAGARNELAGTGTALADTRTELAGARSELAGTRTELADARDGLVDTRREVADARRDAASARAELAGARRELERQRLLCARAYDAIARVRGELAEIGAGPPPEPVEPPGRTAEPPTPLQADPVQAEPLQADRLTAALARLREATPAATPAASPAATPAAPEDAAPPPAEVARAAPARPPKPWLGAVFRELAARDASAAGRLLLALLPAQRAADPQPVAYDLVLGDLACAHVTVLSTTQQFDLGDTPRPLDQVDFQVVGDLASVARLLAASPGRRLLGRLPFRRRVARVRGRRERLSALEHLIDAPLTLGQLHAAGVRLDPVLAMTVAGLMIEPAWTAGERFTIGHRQPAAASPDAYLNVRGGRAPLASAEPPHEAVTSVLVCPADEVLGALAGAATAEVVGEDRPLALVHQWLDRAQSG
jgi:predicted  nucleic acid-binding Zn-ribbon protein